MKILGIDIGITSIGWAVVDDEKGEILGSGVRIFSEPTDKKTGESLAAHRREARGRRRVLRRKRQRVAAVRQLIIKQGIISKQEMTDLFAPGRKLQDIWRVRYEALSRKLNNKDWARVLLYIAKHRAYQSNRKSETADDSPEAVENKRVLGSIQNNEQARKAGGYETVGAMLYDTTRVAKEDKKRRQRRNKGKGDYTLCVSRDLLRDEIAVLFAKQQKLGNPHTSNDLREKYNDKAFDQRPITFNRNRIGKCTFEPKEYRAAKACYSAELFVLISKLNNAWVKNYETGEVVRLTEQRPVEYWLELFKQQKTVSYKKIKKELDLSGNEWKFNHLRYIDPEDKAPIPTDVKKFYEKEDWLAYSPYNQDGILEKQLLAKTEKGEAKKFIKSKYSRIRKILQLPDEQKFAGVNYKYTPESDKFGELKSYHAIKDAVITAKDADCFAGLENADKLDGIATALSLGDEDAMAELEKVGIDDDQLRDKLLTLSFSGFIRLSLTAIKNLLPRMKKGERFDQARDAVYPDIDNKQRGPYLPGLSDDENHQITNPTVKRAFSQFRKVVNAVIRKYGQLDAMHIELARNVNHSKDKRDKITREQEEFRMEKEADKKRFVHLFDREPNPKSQELRKFQLREQQHGKCAYSGKPIELGKEEGQLLSVGYCEIDHILPRSRSLDDSLNNKVLCLKSENQKKGNRTPFEYIANGDVDSEAWHKFKRLVSTFNINRGKRNKLLNTDLPQRWGNKLSDDDVENSEQSFLARNLVDTGYIARFCKNFVEKNLLFGDREDIKQKVKTRNGRLTGQLRHSYGLGNKNRDNNLHHAEDAIIVAFATQGEVKRFSDLMATRESFEYKKAEELQEWVGFTPPFDGFKKAVEESVGSLFVSFAPRRKVSGAAHKQKFEKAFKAFKQTPEGESLKPTFVKIKKSGYAKKGEMKRIDVFKNIKGRYAFVPFYANDFYKKELTNVPLGGKESLPESYEFQFSLFKGDLIAFKPKNGSWSKGYFRYIKSDGRIIFQPHRYSQIDSKEEIDEEGNSKVSEWIFSTGTSLSESGLKKYHVDVLGECHEVKGEKRLPTIKQMRAVKKQKMKKH